MQEGVIEDKSVMFILVIRQVVLGRHIVALIPICFPLTKDWVSWLNVEVYLILVSERI